VTASGLGHLELFGLIANSSNRAGWSGHDRQRLSVQHLWKAYFCQLCLDVNLAIASTACGTTK
jgi:hypothetical protein